MAQVDLYPNTTGVRSEVLEERIRQEVLPPSPNAILVLGVATDGPLLTPMRIDTNNAETIFGTNVTDAYTQYNLLKGFYEIVGSEPDTEVIGVRIGAATKSSLTLYESQVSSGVMVPQSGLTASLTISAVTEGLDGNDVLAEVYGDENDVPTRLIMTLPDGTVVDAFNFTTYTRPSTVAAAINAHSDVSQYVRATSNLITKTDTVTIVEGTVSGQIQTSYDLSERTLVDITSAYIQSEYVDESSVVAGRSTATLAKTPIKDLDPNSPTISKFWKVVTSETVVSSADPDTYSYVDLVACNADSYWESVDTEAITDYVIYVTPPAGSQDTASEDDGDYSININTGRVTFSASYLEELNGGVATSYLPAGTKVVASYRYCAAFAEAVVRSALEVGDPHQYFVGGDTIVFGAGQSLDLVLSYNSNTQFSIPADLIVSDADDGTVQFRGVNKPSIGDVVSIAFIFEPELPAVKATSLSGTQVQLSQLSGGADGRRITSLSQYYTELAKGYLAADNTPCRIVVPQGIYVDDVLDGIDYETGMPTNTNAGFHTQLATYVARHSQYVSECYGIMAMRPMAAGNPAVPTNTEKETWYTNLISVSATDGTVAANVVSSIQDRGLVIPLGDLLLSHSKINNGAIYVEGAHNIYAAAKYHHDNLTSMTAINLPIQLVRGIQYRIAAVDRINALVGMRYTPIIVDSDTGAYKVAAAPTLAATDSKFRKQYNLDITIEAINMVRRALKPFIGHPNKQTTRENMRIVAKQALKTLQPEKLIGFDVQVIATQSEAISGNCQVELLLVTAVELERIKIRTRIELGF